MAKSLRNGLLSFLLALVGIAAALVLAEITVRMFFPESILPRHVVDPGYGVRANQPDVVTRHYVPGDYDVTVSTNSVGMRGTREYAVDKPREVYRIAVIGDSFIFGHGVNDNEVVSAHLEETLNNDLGRAQRRYETINFSVSGFGQAEQLVTYQERIRDYQPDLVVLFYFSNDIGNNAVSRLFRLDQGGKLERTGKSYLPGVEIRERLYGFAPTRWLFTHSQLWNLIRNRLSALVQQSLLKEQGLKGFNDTKPEAVDLTRALLIQFIADIKRDGGRAIVFVIPARGRKENVSPSNFPLLEDEVRASGATLIDGAKYVTPADYYVDDQHWRASGHARAAQLLAQIITAQAETADLNNAAER